MVENTDKWVIFDLDGTLADIEIRRKMAINSKGKMDWDIFFAPALVAEDDPHLEGFKTMGEQKVAQVRIVPATGAEKFAEFIFHKLNNFVKTETQERVKVKQVEFREHGKNSAIYSE